MALFRRKGSKGVYMNLNRLFLNEFPKNVRRAFFLLIGGWGAHFLFLYLFFSLAQGTVPEKILYQQLAIVGLLGYFLYQAKKWARPLCLLCNVLIIVLYACFTVLFIQSRPGLGGLAVAVIVFFGAASYLLLGREAKAFFGGTEKNATENGQ